MGRGTIRAGAPTTGTQAADGTDNDLTDPRIILFDPAARPCIVTNHCTNSEVLVKVNTVEVSGVASETFTQANGLGHFVIPPKETKFVADGGTEAPDGGARHVDVSCVGQIIVHSVAICTTHASDDLDDVSVVGWGP
jgi:hypothetical protein